MSVSGRAHKHTWLVNLLARTGKLYRDSGLQTENIDREHATILAWHANPTQMGFSESTSLTS